MESDKTREPLLFDTETKSRVGFYLSESEAPITHLTPPSDEKIEYEIWEKLLIKEGKWTQPDQDITLDVTLDRMKGWIENHPKVAAHADVFIPRRHSRDPMMNTGSVETLFTKQGDDGAELWGRLNVKDAVVNQKLHEGTMGSVSICVDPHGRIPDANGSGEIIDLGEIIEHVAWTPLPMASQNIPPVHVAFDREGNETSYFLLSRENGEKLEFQRNVIGKNPPKEVAAGTDRVDKGTAHYRLGGGSVRCGNCIFFRFGDSGMFREADGRCTVVEGPILQDRVSDFFRAREVTFSDDDDDDEDSVTNLAAHGDGKTKKKKKKKKTELDNPVPEKEAEMASMSELAKELGFDGDLPEDAREAAAKLKAHFESSKKPVEEPKKNPETPPVEKSPTELSVKDSQEYQDLQLKTLELESKNINYETRIKSLEGDQVNRRQDRVADRKHRQFERLEKAINEGRVKSAQAKIVTGDYKFEFESEKDLEAQEAEAAAFEAKLEVFESYAPGSAWPGIDRQVTKRYALDADGDEDVDEEAAKIENERAEKIIKDREQKDLDVEALFERTGMKKYHPKSQVVESTRVG